MKSKFESSESTKKLRVITLEDDNFNPILTHFPLKIWDINKQIDSKITAYLHEKQQSFSNYFSSSPSRVEIYKLNTPINIHNMLYTHEICGMFTDSAESASFGLEAFIHSSKSIQNNIRQFIKDGGCIFLYNHPGQRHGYWGSDDEIRKILRTHPGSFGDEQRPALPLDGIILGIEIGNPNLNFRDTIVHEFEHHDYLQFNYAPERYALNQHGLDLSILNTLDSFRADPFFHRGRNLYLGERLPRSLLSCFFEDMRQYYNNNLPSYFFEPLSPYHHEIIFKGPFRAFVQKLQNFYEYAVQPNVIETICQTELTNYIKNGGQPLITIIKKIKKELPPIMPMRSIRNHISQAMTSARIELGAFWGQIEGNTYGLTFKMAPRTTIVLSQLKSSRIDIPPQLIASSEQIAISHGIQNPIKPKITSKKLTIERPRIIQLDYRPSQPHQLVKNLSLHPPRLTSTTSSLDRPLPRFTLLLKSLKLNTVPNNVQIHTWKVRSGIIGGSSRPVYQKIHYKNLGNTGLPIVLDAFNYFSLLNEERKNFPNNSLLSNHLAAAMDIGLNLGISKLIGPAQPLVILCQIANAIRDIPPESARNNRAIFLSEINDLDLPPAMEVEWLKAWDRGEAWTREMNVIAAKHNKFALKPWEWLYDLLPFEKWNQLKTKLVDSSRECGEFLHNFKIGPDENVFIQLKPRKIPRSIHIKFNFSNCLKSKKTSAMQEEKNNSINDSNLLTTSQPNRKVRSLLSTGNVKLSPINTLPELAKQFDHSLKSSNSYGRSNLIDQKKLNDLKPSPLQLGPLDLVELGLPNLEIGVQRSGKISIQESPSCLTSTQFEKVINDITQTVAEQIPTPLNLHEISNGYLSQQNSNRLSNYSVKLANINSNISKSPFIERLQIGVIDGDKIGAIATLPNGGEIGCGVGAGGAVFFCAKLKFGAGFWSALGGTAAVGAVAAVILFTARFFYQKHITRIQERIEKRDTNTKIDILFINQALDQFSEHLTQQNEQNITSLVNEANKLIPHLEDKFRTEEKRGREDFLESKRYRFMDIFDGSHKRKDAADDASYKHYATAREYQSQLLNLKATKAALEQEQICANFIKENQTKSSAELVSLAKQLTDKSHFTPTDVANIKGLQTLILFKVHTSIAAGDIKTAQELLGGTYLCRYFNPGMLPHFTLQSSQYKTQNRTQKDIDRINQYVDAINYQISSGQNPISTLNELQNLIFHGNSNEPSILRRWKDRSNAKGICNQLEEFGHFLTLLRNQYKDGNVPSDLGLQELFQQVEMLLSLTELGHYREAAEFLRKMRHNDPSLNFQELEEDFDFVHQGQLLSIFVKPLYDSLILYIRAGQSSKFRAPLLRVFELINTIQVFAPPHAPSLITLIMQAVESRYSTGNVSIVNRNLAKLWEQFSRDINPFNKDFSLFNKENYCHSAIIYGQLLLKLMQILPLNLMVAEKRQSIAENIRNTLVWTINSTLSIANGVVIPVLKFKTLYSKGNLFSASFSAELISNLASSAIDLGYWIYQKYQSSHGKASENPDHYLQQEWISALLAVLSATISAYSLTQKRDITLAAAMVVGGANIYKVNYCELTKKEAARKALIGAITNINFYQQLKKSLPGMVLQLKQNEKAKITVPAVISEYTGRCIYHFIHGIPSPDIKKRIKRGQKICFTKELNNEKSVFYIYIHNKNGYIEQIPIQESPSFLSLFTDHAYCYVLPGDPDYHSVLAYATRVCMDNYTFSSRNNIAKLLINHFNGLIYDPEQPEEINESRIVHLSSRVKEYYELRNYTKVLQWTKKLDLEGKVVITTVYQLPPHLVWQSLNCRLLAFAKSKDLLSQFWEQFQEYGTSILDSAKSSMLWYNAHWEEVKQGFAEILEFAFNQFILTAYQAETVEEKLHYLSLLTTEYKDNAEWHQGLNWEKVLKDELKLLVAYFYYALDEQKTGKLFLRKVSGLPLLIKNSKQKDIINIALKMFALIKNTQILEIFEMLKTTQQEELWVDALLELIKANKYKKVANILQANENFKGKCTARAALIFYSSNKTRIFDTLKKLMQEKHRELSFWQLMHDVLSHCLDSTKYAKNQQSILYIKAPLSGFIKIAAKKIQYYEITIDWEEKIKRSIKTSTIDIEKWVRTTYGVNFSDSQFADEITSLMRQYNQYLQEENPVKFLTALRKFLVQISYEYKERDKKIITYLPIDVPADNDCAFHVLGISRAEGIDLLLRHLEKRQWSDDENSRDRKVINFLFRDLEIDRNRSFERTEENLEILKTHILTFKKPGVWIPFNQQSPSIFNALALLLGKNLRVFERNIDGDLVITSSSIDDETLEILNVFYTSASGISAEENSKNQNNKNHFIRLIPLWRQRKEVTKRLITKLPYASYDFKLSACLNLNEEIEAKPKSSIKTRDLKSRDLYLMSELPPNLTSYKNSYIFLQKNDIQELHYIKCNGVYEKVKIVDFNLFKEKITTIKKQDEPKLQLNEKQIFEIITSNGGHRPWIKVKFEKDANTNKNIVNIFSFFKKNSSWGRSEKPYAGIFGVKYTKGHAYEIANEDLEPNKKAGPTDNIMSADF